MLQKIEDKALRNVDAEGAIIGAMISDNKLIDRFADSLTVSDFYETIHARLFEAIVREHSLGKPVTPITLKPFFENDGPLKELGGMGYIVTLASILAGGAALGYIDQIKEMSGRRALIDALHDAADFAGDMNNTRAQVVAAVDGAILADESADSGVVQISAHDAFWEMVEDANNRAPGVSPAAIPSMTEAMGPIRPHHLAILAGRPGMGKTCAAMSYALSVASEGHGVLFVSLEMSRTELMQRAAADMIFDGQYGVPYSAIRDNDLTDNARRRMHECGSRLRAMPFHIIDAGSLAIGRLNMLVRRYKRRMEAAGTPLELVVVDYLQLVRPDQRTSNTVDAVSEVSRGLKAIAKTYDVGVMALAQLNRGVEQRDDKRPKLSDLRDSGQIEQDADAVLFLFRPEYYLRQAGDGGDPAKYEAALEACRGKIEFICAKRRNGEAQTTVGQFHGVYQAVRG